MNRSNVRDDGSRNDSLPWSLKYAFDANHGVLIAGNAYAHNAALELSGTCQRGAASASQILGAINYNRSVHLVLDVGLAYGLTHAAHDVSIFAGATVYLGRLR